MTFKAIIRITADNIFYLYVVYFIVFYFIITNIRQFV